jgi:hypothetical protein
MGAGDDAQALFAAEIIHDEMMQGGPLARRAVETNSREIEQCRGGGGIHFVARGVVDEEESGAVYESRRKDWMRGREDRPLQKDQVGA